MKKTLLEIDLSVIENYDLWASANKEKWNIMSYLNQFYEANAAIAFSKLYFPDFVEKEGCIILAARYNEKIFNEWKTHFRGDISMIESKCNLYEVADFFHINKIDSNASNSHHLIIKTLASVLKRSWELNCQLLFPDRQIIVDVICEFETTYITLYSKQLES